MKPDNKNQAASVNLENLRSAEKELSAEELDNVVGSGPVRNDALTASRFELTIDGHSLA